ncbi:hypothetical protein WG66_014847 [Moniliophthora roreri]|nr:hypothetical protein WG66_014847 [Moniliophthora roreri]
MDAVSPGLTGTRRSSLKDAGWCGFEARIRQASLLSSLIPSNAIPVVHDVVRCASWTIRLRLFNLYVLE